MRLVFVNHCHPDLPHVCAARLRDFAVACAAAGHRVVLLTETLPGEPSVLSPAALPAALDRHDWRKPFYLACDPLPDRLVARARAGRLAPPLRKALIAAFYLARSGVFTDWRDGSRPYWRALADGFRPDAVWATFGNTDALAIARGIAGLAGCRWVLDIKDPWSVFIPRPLRRILAGRFAGCAGLTSLSAGHADEAARWFGRRATVVYSGIDRSFLPPPPPVRGQRRLLVVGGLYAAAHLAALMAGIAQWVQGGETVTYAGSEGARFKDAARAFADRVKVETPGYVGLDRLRALAADSAALLYVRNPDALYQHKLIELLSLDRPVISVPGESPEAHGIADALGARLISCAEASDVAAGLTKAMASGPVAVNRSRLVEYTWESQAMRLLAVLERGA